MEYLWEYFTTSMLLDLLISEGLFFGKTLKRKNAKKKVQKWRDSCQEQGLELWEALELRREQRKNNLDTLGTINTVNNGFYYVSGSGWTTDWNTPPAHIHNFSLDTLPCAVVGDCPEKKASCNPTPIKGFVKKEKRMRYDDFDRPIAETEAEAKRAYLADRAMGVYYKIDADLEKAFGLKNDDAPTTVSDLVKRIKENKFEIKKDREDEYTFNPLSLITWRDPNVKKDKDGYKAAKALLEKKQTEVADIIAIGDAKDALDAIKAFENWKPEGLPN